jgi:ketosteroid isomerase-like protein
MAYAQHPGMTFREHVEALSSRFLADFRVGDAAACARAYTADVKVIHPGGHITDGRDALTKDWQSVFDGGSYIISDLVTLDCEADGGIGYATQLVRTPDEEFYVMLALRRDPQGAWEVALEVVNGKA